MTLQSLSCPNCGGIITDFDDAMKKGTCSYCGAVITDSLDIQEGYSSVNALDYYDLALQYLDLGDRKKAETYLSLFLEAHPKSFEACKLYYKEFSTTPGIFKRLKLIASQSKDSEAQDFINQERSRVSGKLDSLRTQLAEAKQLTEKRNVIECQIDNLDAEIKQLTNQVWESERNQSELEIRNTFNRSDVGFGFVLGIALAILIPVFSGIYELFLIAPLFFFAGMLGGTYLVEDIRKSSISRAKSSANHYRERVEEKRQEIGILRQRADAIISPYRVGNLVREISECEALLSV